MGRNEIYARVRNQGLDLATLARDDTDYKPLIAQAPSPAEKLALAEMQATRRLASGVVLSSTPALRRSNCKRALEPLWPRWCGTPNE